MRRIPFSRRAKVNERLEELLKLDVIEKIQGPTSLVNPLVVVEKPNGDIRICLDIRQANQAIVREKHPVLTVEETLQEVSYAEIFSKLDLNMAFHQIELHSSFLGYVQFCAKFIPKFATISSPLWDLTYKAAEWCWRPREDKSFRDVKTRLTHAPVMAYH